MIFWLIPILITLALNVAAVLLTPKPKAPKPAAVQEAQDPTAEAGKPQGVMFGTMTVASPNVLWFGDKTSETYQIKV